MLSTTRVIDFLGIQKITFGFSLVMLILSIVGLGVRGIHWGLDFTGGIVIELHAPQAAVDVTALEEALKSHDFAGAVVQHYGSSQDVLVRLDPKVKGAAHVGDAVRTVAQSLSPDIELVRVDAIGAQLGKEWAEQGILAVIVAMLGTALYIAFRFQARFAVGAALALLHDPIMILGVFSWFQIEFDLPTLAGLLAVIGYSLNDTVVVFDRIKENLLRYKKETPHDVVNTSLTQTLSRTLMTSFLTLLVVIALLCFGGATLRGFSIALCIGIVVGTYSSIYIASAIALLLGIERGHLVTESRSV